MNKHLTIRGLIVGLLGLVVITASSMYVALRMGALPWPTIFVTVVSMAALSKAKNSSLQEINVTHTIMSSGAMVAGGLAFTLPGLWMIAPDASFSTIKLIVLTVVGAILGTLFSAIFRKKLIEEEKLPFPMGRASYNTLQASVKGGHGAKTLFASMGGSVIFTALRDGFGKIPALLTIFKGSAILPAFSIWVSPMAMGIGAIIGPLFALVWFGGAILGYYLLIPIGLASGLFSSMAEADIFRSNLGIGLMIGTGLGVFIKAVISKAKETKKTKDSKKMNSRTQSMILLVLVLAIILLSLGTDISFFEAIIVIVGIYLTTYLSGMLTGQTGINPMEIFGILVLLVVQLVSHPSLVASFSIAAVTAVACGLTGDVMNDLKSGYLLGTDTRQQLLGEGIGGVVGAVLSVFVLLIMKASFGGFGTLELPAPQAAAVAAMVGGLSNVPAFLAGCAIGLALYLSNLPSATLGLGVYLPIYISSIMGLGAVLSSLIKKIFAKKYSKERLGEESGLVASGLLGGEGITGVAIAILSMLK
ncbi:OPT/YSL family transporter [Sphaerochaeta sp. PS]|uniref:OPT/YSL family transporter n=1 Tax=Sphaerochaeta sp. PS TaxID=3076336 RepID=UPI0028A4BFB6|nr:OPT/YSL family transporter [Sphaerochaeta sp. PS]MDT4761354.1 OPT/YSL family transporter [Sphaerochaeta sp. PS]